MKIEQEGAVTSIWETFYPGWAQWLCFMSDVHLDSMFSNRDLFFQHLDMARERQARVAIVGDLFDAMQGKWDKRRSYCELRPEYRTDKYLDAIVEDVGKMLTPYAELFDVIADGNHETGVLKNCNTSLSDRLVAYLNMTCGTSIKHGGYGGWIRWMLLREDGTPSTSVRIKYYHGSGGEAEVTKGTIRAQRQAVYLPDANIVVNGHNHNSYAVPYSRERLSNKGRQYFDLQWHLRTPGYKQDYGDGQGGWAVERGGSPKPLGCCFVKLSWDGKSTVKITPEPQVEGSEPIFINPADTYGGPVFNDDGDDL